MSSELEKLKLALKRTQGIQKIAARAYKASGADMLDIEQRILELENLIDDEERKGKK